jgi:hypothetical protein
VVAFDSFAFSAVLGGVGGGWAAEARRENNPLRGFEGAFVVVGVVGVGEDMTLVMGVDEEEEEAPSTEGDCGVTGSGFVTDRVLPLLFGREPKIAG